MIVLFNEIGARNTPPEAIHRGDNKVAYNSGGSPPLGVILHAPNSSYIMPKLG